MRNPLARRQPTNGTAPYLEPLALQGALSDDLDGSCVLLVAVMDSRSRVLGWTGIPEGFRPVFDKGHPGLALHDVSMDIDHTGRATKGALIGVDGNRNAGLWASFPLGEPATVSRGETFTLYDFVIRLYPD